jgi:hypothetical protein
MKTTKDPNRIWATRIRSRSVKHSPRTFGGRRSGAVQLCSVEPTFVFIFPFKNRILLSEQAQAVRLPDSIREEPGSNLDQDNDYPDWIFSRLSSISQRERQDILK